VESETRRLILQHQLDASVVAYGSGNAPWAGRAGTQLDTVIIAPGAAAGEVYVCPPDCAGAQDCDSQRFGCSAPNARRFSYLFGSFSPAETYWSQFVSLSASKQAKTVAFVYENEKSFTRAMIEGARTAAYNLGLDIVADIGIAVGGSDTMVPDVLTSQLDQNGIASDVIRENIKIDGTWEDASEPFVNLINRLEVDVVVGGTYYASCVGLVKAFLKSGKLPQSLGVAACVGDPKLYGDLDKNLRWLSGPSQWDERLTGSDYTDFPYNPVNHYPVFEASDVPSAQQFFDAYVDQWGERPSYQVSSVPRKSAWQLAV